MSPLELRRPVTALPARRRRGRAALLLATTSVVTSAVAGRLNAYVLEGQQWVDQNTSTPNTIDIYYDFRDITKNGTTYHNDLTDNTATAATERSIFQQALNDWSTVTGGKVVFTQQTTGNNVITLGLGDLTAVGGQPGQNGVLGLGGGAFFPDNHYVSGFAWLNDSYTFDNVIGNGNPANTFDFYETALHEIGHAIGLDHSESSPANIMTSIDKGEKISPSQDDINGVQAIYGSNHADPNVDYTAVTRTIAGDVIVTNNGFYNDFGSGAASFRYVVDSSTTTILGKTQINFGGFEQYGGNWTHQSVQIADTQFIWNGSPHYTLAGGTMTVVNAVTVGGTEAGAFNVTGGAATLGSLTVGSGNGKGSALNLSGGSVTVNGATTVTANGILNVTGGTLNAQALTSTGTNTIGGGGSAAQVNVSRFSFNKLTIGDNGTLAVGVATPSVTNTATALTISGAGRLDLGNHALVTSTASNTIQQYVLNGYAGGAWNGAGGIGSSYAATHAGYGVGYGINASAQSVAKVTLLGDTTLKGTVGFGDYQTLLSNFGKTAGATWAQGDTNYDGAVSFGDYQALLSNFGKTSATGAAQLTGAAAPASATLTGSTASASTAATASAVAPASSAVQPFYHLSLVTNAATHTYQVFLSLTSGDNAGLATYGIDVIGTDGDVVTTSKARAPRGFNADQGLASGFSTQVSNGATGVEITASQALAYAGANDPDQDALVFQHVGQVAGSQDGATWAQPVLIADGTYAGNDPGGLFVRVHPGDQIQVLAQVNGGNWSGPGNILTAVDPTPEPSTLSILAIGTVGLLARHRRRCRTIA